MTGRFGQLGPRAIFLSFTLGAAALAIGTFIRITQELLEREVDAVDRTLLLRVIAWRTPWLNAVMVDMTALGSATLVALFSLLALAVFAAMRAWSNALQLAAASLGSLVWTVVTKSFIELLAIHLDITTKGHECKPIFGAAP